MVLPMNLLWSSVPTATHVTVGLNTIIQKLKESLHIYVSHYSRFHFVLTEESTHENTILLGFIILN